MSLVSTLCQFIAFQSPTLTLECKYLQPRLALKPNICFKWINSRGTWWDHCGGWLSITAPNLPPVFIASSFSRSAIGQFEQIQLSHWLKKSQFHHSYPGLDIPTPWQYKLLQPIIFCWQCLRIRTKEMSVSRPVIGYLSPVLSSHWL